MGQAAQPEIGQSSTPAETPPALSREQYDLLIRAAEREHDNATNFAAKANEAAVKAAEEAIKAVILINGGSSVAMLAFIGTIASKHLLTSGQLAVITSPLLYFGFGVATAVVGSAMAYFTNLMMSGHSSRKRRDYKHPFLFDTPSSKRHLIVGELCRWIGIVAVTASIAHFVTRPPQASSAFKVRASDKPPVVSN